MRMATTGILFCIWGEQAHMEQEQASSRLAEIAPEVPIRILVKEAVPHLGPKLEALTETPFERTLFLDTDTWCIDNPVSLFELLDRFDILMAPAPREVENRGLVPPNSGVIVYHRKAIPVLREAADRYRCQDIPQPQHPDQRPCDQIYIADGIRRSDLRYWSLPPTWNFRLPFAQVAFGRVHLLHGRPRITTFTEIANRLNATTSPRLWDPKTESVRPMNDA